MSDRRGRPRLAAEISQLPATRVPASVHDAIIREAAQREIKVAEVIREAVISHLHNRQRQAVVHTER